MFNVGTGELLLIMVLALIVLGPDKLPTAARQAGRYLAEIRGIANGFQSEFRKAIDSAMDESSDAKGFELPDFPDLGFGSSSHGLADRVDKDVQVAPEIVDDEPAVSLDKTDHPSPTPDPSPPPSGPTSARGHVAVDGPSSSFS
jgi:sec-independent protein translocase protein TatB